MAAVSINLEPFDKAFARTIGHEGRFCNNPLDSGGATCWGITERVARAHGYAAPMRDMPIGVAKRIYQEDYWDLLRLGDIATSMPKLACELFDAAVNCGAGTAARWLQRALNGLNLHERLYADIPEDGRIGRLTLMALAALLTSRGADAETALFRLVDGQQASYYLSLAISRSKDEEFLFGWVMNRVGVMG